MKNKNKLGKFKKKKKVSDRPVTSLARGIFHQENMLYDHIIMF